MLNSKMKKVFSIVALVGLLAACQPEEIVTAFDAVDAEATVNVTAVNINDTKTVLSADKYSIVAEGVDGSKITAEVVGNTIKIKPAGGKAYIVATDIMVKGKLNEAGEDYCEPIKVSIPNVSANTTVNLSCTLALGTVPDPVVPSGYKAVLNMGDPNVGTPQSPVALVDADNEHDQTDHAGQSWYINPTSELILATFKYTIYTGEELVAGSLNVTDSEWQEAIDMLVGVYQNSRVEIEKEYLFSVEPYSIYRAWSQSTPSVRNCEVVLVNKDDATDTKTIATFQVESIENLAYNEQMVDYLHDPHAHGNSGNAGGGIGEGE